MEHPRHRLPAFNYKGRRAYFLTVCTANRQKHFDKPEVANALVEALRQQFQRHDFSVYAYCFMTDHCHVLAVAVADTAGLAKAVRAFKGASVAIARGFGIERLWQRDYYEHILRSSEHLGAVAAYILQNPMRAGLATAPGDWPYSGSIMFGWNTQMLLASTFSPDWKRKPQRDKPAAT